jgi:ABC-type molybdate transport system ATPase subunit
MNIVWILVPILMIARSVDAILRIADGKTSAYHLVAKSMSTSTFATTTSTGTSASILQVILHSHLPLTLMEVQLHLECARLQKLLHCA